MGFGSSGIAGASGSRRGVSFLNGEEIAHAKDAKGGKVYKGFIFLGKRLLTPRSQRSGTLLHSADALLQRAPEAGGGRLGNPALVYVLFRLEKN